jgi:5-methylcytosine-specific restriction endonuclease McrBC regulatory subunit McrC
MKHTTRISMQEYENLAVKLPKRSHEVLKNLKHFLSVSRLDSQGVFDVKASHWVGSIILPDGYVSVAPKVGGTNALRMMLEGEGELPENWKECLARVDSSELWDVLALALRQEMSLIRAAGYQGAYVEEDDNRQCVRGKLLPMEDLRSNFPVRRGIYSRDTIWSFDIEVNQALNWAASALLNLAKFDTAQALRAEATLLSGIQEIAPRQDWLPEPGDRYRRAIFLAQLVRKAWSPQTSLFGFAAHNAIVNMYNVFESFVRTRLRSFAVKKGLIVQDKGTFHRSLSKNAPVKPDIVITNIEGHVLAVGDVKYKWKWDFKNTDIYQINAYLDAFPETLTAYIFYPDDALTPADFWVEQLPRGKILICVPLNPKRMFDAEIWTNICQVIVSNAMSRHAA